MKRYGQILGVPYDFRRPRWSRTRERMWNPDDERIITPRDFGIGWTLNLYQLRKRYPPLFWLLLAGVAARIIWGIARYFRKEEDER